MLKRIRIFYDFMKFLRFLIVSAFLFFSSNLSAEESLSSIIKNLIPGEGHTEASIQINEEGDPDFEILAVRDISADEKSNLFTQFSFHTQEINNEGRYITNLGIGYRALNEDKTMMLGMNTFYDYEFEGHARASIGLEAKASILDFTANSYHKLTNMQVVNGTEEQVLTGHEINLASQIPYMPWSKINWQNYKWENEKASKDTKGNKLSLEMLLSPSLQFDATGDFSDLDGVDDEFNYKLTYFYPPKENSKTLQDGLVSDLAFEKENMEHKLKEKVRRSNNMVVEIQGSIIVTSK